MTVATRITVVTMALVLSTGASHAQKGDAAQLRNCMTLGGVVTTCLGLVSGPCLDEHDNLATVAMANCFDKKQRPGIRS